MRKNKLAVATMFAIVTGNAFATFEMIGVQDGVVYGTCTNPYTSESIITTQLNCFDQLAKADRANYDAKLLEEQRKAAQIDSERQANRMNSKPVRDAERERVRR